VLEELPHDWQSNDALRDGGTWATTSDEAPVPMAPTSDAGRVVAVNGIANVQSRMSDDCDGGSSSQKGSNGARKGDDAVCPHRPCLVTGATRPEHT